MHTGKHTTTQPHPSSPAWSPLLLSVTPLSELRTSLDPFSLSSSLLSCLHCFQGAGGFSSTEVDLKGGWREGLSCRADRQAEWCWVPWSRDQAEATFLHELGVLGWY